MKVVVLMFLFVFMVQLILMPQPALASGCHTVCDEAPCYAGQSATGFYPAYVAVWGNNWVTLESPLGCSDGRGHELYSSCVESGCNTMSASLRFEAHGQQVSVFSVRGEEREQIATFPVSEFKQRRGALEARYIPSCSNGKRA